MTDVKQRAKEAIDSGFSTEWDDVVEYFDVMTELLAIVEAQEWNPITEPPFNVYIYSFMTTVHGNTRDFEEEDCDYLAELIEESFDVRHKVIPLPPITEEG